MLKTNTQIIAQLFNTSCEKINFTGVSINSKNCDNALFVAIIGTKFDAHDFIDDAIKNGAKAVVVEKKIKVDIPQIIVEDTTIALGLIAKYHLQQINPTTIAITGSNGKTTTKNMLFNILNQVQPTLKTQGNLNNHIGVPLTLLSLKPQHKYAIIEMGANHLGEIKYLRDLVEPDIACVINTLDAHLGEFGGKENLIKAKGEIYHKNSINIVNTTTNFSGDISFGRGGCIDFDKLKDVNLQLIGVHNLENALASIACVEPFKLDFALIKSGLEKTQAEKGRLEILHTANNLIINDCYNASPSSTKYALKTLADFKQVKIAILGNMAELGDKSSEMHAKIGEYAKKLKIDYLYSIGDLAQNYGITHFESQQKLVETLKTHKNCVILFKGSRSAKLENILQKLL